MNRIIFLLLFALTFIFPDTSSAQIQKPKAQWTYTFSKNEIKKGETVDLIFTATIDKDWYMYSSDFDPDLGPMLTSFTFEKNNSFEVVGKLKPQNPKTKFEEVWNGNVRYFEGKGVFKQTVKYLRTIRLSKEAPNTRRAATYRAYVSLEMTILNSRD